MMQGPQASGWHYGHGSRGGWRVSLWGIFLVVLGVYWILGLQGYVAFRWEYAAALFLIGMGLSRILRRAMWGGGCYCAPMTSTGPSEEPPKTV